MENMEIKLYKQILDFPINQKYTRYKLLLNIFGELVYLQVNHHFTLKLRHTSKNTYKRVAINNK